MFTRQEVIARLDLTAQPSKYQGRFLEPLRGRRQLVTAENTSGERTMVSVLEAVLGIQSRSELRVSRKDVSVSASGGG